jgi:hypothetical protein
VADASFRREDYKQTNSLSVQKNKEMTGISAYFCDADEKILSGLLSTMHLVPR